MFNRFAVFTTMLCAAVVSSTPNLQAQKADEKNIALVHGAWADGSGWRGVYDNLVRDGFKVSIVQEPETSFQDDVTAVKRILALQDGPSILVEHSYGGAVITEAGTYPSVAGLVYVAAHMPGAGENEADAEKRFPTDLSKLTCSGVIKLDERVRRIGGQTRVQAKFVDLDRADVPYLLGHCLGMLPAARGVGSGSISDQVAIEGCRP
jgi:pimeloyl-ACP methyl ester carboxylesterase